MKRKSLTEMMEEVSQNLSFEKSKELISAIKSEQNIDELESFCRRVENHYNLAVKMEKKISRDYYRLADQMEEESELFSYAENRISILKNELHKYNDDFEKLADRMSNLDSTKRYLFTQKDMLPQHCIADEIEHCDIELSALIDLVEHTNYNRYNIMDDLASVNKEHEHIKSFLKKTYKQYNLMKTKKKYWETMVIFYKGLNRKVKIAANELRHKSEDEEDVCALRKAGVKKYIAEKVADFFCYLGLSTKKRTEQRKQKMHEYLAEPFVVKNEKVKGYIKMDADCLKELYEFYDLVKNKSTDLNYYIDKCKEKHRDLLEQSARPDYLGELDNKKREVVVEIRAKSEDLRSLEEARSDLIFRMKIFRQKYHLDSERATFYQNAVSTLRGAA